MKTLQEKIELGIKVSKKMISEMEAKLQKEIDREDYERAAGLKSYISGMNQILIIFEQAIH